MLIKKSFVLSATFPSSKNSLDELKTAIEFIDPFDFSVIEFYCANCDAEKVGKLLGERQGVFLAAALQKAQNLNLCTRVTEDRKKAIDALAECFLFARDTGAKSVLINSGARPENDEFDAICLEYLKDSICQLHHRVNDIDILLEPGDRDVEFHHLVGHTDMAVSFMENIAAEIPRIGLVFDISHIAQLNENPYSSWSIAKKYCTHIHLANCVLKKDSPLYGDKHPLFSHKDGVYSHEYASNFFRFLQDENLPLTIGIEVICRGDSEQRFFERLVSETGWFFKYK